MRRGRILLTALAVLASAALFNASSAQAPTPAPANTATPTPDNAVMLTIFLKHDQSRPLAELNAQLEKQGFYKAFPPDGIEVVSWYVMMGIGQVVTLRLPASRLREVNRIFETMAWAPIAPSSTRPMTTSRSASPITRRRSSDGDSSPPACPALACTARLYLILPCFVRASATTCWKPS
jgi:hypothetical protein